MSVFVTLGFSFPFEAVVLESLNFMLELLLTSVRGDCLFFTLIPTIAFDSRVFEYIFFPSIFNISSPFFIMILFPSTETFTTSEGIFSFKRFTVISFPLILTSFRYKPSSSANSVISPSVGILGDPNILIYCSDVVSLLLNIISVSIFFIDISAAFVFTIKFFPLN